MAKFVAGQIMDGYLQAKASIKKGESVEILYSEGSRRISEVCALSLFKYANSCWTQSSLTLDEERMCFSIDIPNPEREAPV